MPLAKIFANDIEVDVNDTNYISQDGMKDLLNFRILNGDDPVMGYHDHPSEMWISEKHRPLALYMEEQKWLTVQFPKRR